MVGGQIEPYTKYCKCAVNLGDLKIPYLIRISHYSIDAAMKLPQCITQVQFLIPSCPASGL